MESTLPLNSTFELHELKKNNNNCDLIDVVRLYCVIVELELVYYSSVRFFLLYFS